MTCKAHPELSGALFVRKYDEQKSGSGARKRCPNLENVLNKKAPNYLRDFLLSIVRNYFTNSTSVEDFPVTLSSFFLPLRKS